MAKEKKVPGKPGAPRADISMEKLEKICQFKPTVRWAADFFGVHFNTLQNRIKQETGLTFDEYRDRHMVHTRLMLIQTAVEQAKAGNAKVLLACLKEFCDWDTKKGPDVVINNNANSLNNDQLDAKIMELLKEAKIAKE